MAFRLLLPVMHCVYSLVHQVTFLAGVVKVTYMIYPVCKNMEVSRQPLTVMNVRVGFTYFVYYLVLDSVADVRQVLLWLAVKYLSTG